jgi:hypothetical protein
VTRANARPMEFCYPPVHTNGPKLRSDCYEPMAVRLQLRELGGMQPPCCNCRRLLAYPLEVTGGRSLRRAAPRVNPNSQDPSSKQFPSTNHQTYPPSGLRLPTNAIKPGCSFEPWSLMFPWDLDLGVWDFERLHGQTANRSRCARRFEAEDSLNTYGIGDPGSEQSFEMSMPG